jgi:hypothetical protein
LGHKDDKGIPKYPREIEKDASSMGGTCGPIALSWLLLDEPENKCRKVKKLKAEKAADSAS